MVDIPSRVLSSNIQQKEYLKFYENKTSKLSFHSYKLFSKVGDNSPFRNNFAIPFALELPCNTNGDIF